jgi:hypothetical protein
VIFKFSGDKFVSTKFKNPRIVQQFLEILEKEGIETLEEWNKVSEEQKKKYPDGLKNFLNDLNTKTTELEEIVSQKFKDPATFQRFKDILIENGLYNFGLEQTFWRRKEDISCLFFMEIYWKEKHWIWQH